MRGENKNKTSTEESCSNLFWPFQNKFFKFAKIIAVLYKGREKGENKDLDHFILVRNITF